MKDADAFRGTRFIVLFHYALWVWNASHQGTWSLYGHSHGDLDDLEDSLSFDVGVDCHDFRPLSYEQVKTIMQGKDWTSPLKSQ